VLDPLPLAEVLAALRVARERFEANEGDYAVQRDSCAFSLSAVVAYLHQIPEIARDLEPLAALLSALTNLQSGGHHPLFEVRVKKKHGGQPISNEERYMQSFGVALVELLMEFETPEEEAVTKVAASFAAAGLVGTRKRVPITPSVVREWRSQANASASNNLRSMSDQRLRELHDSWRIADQPIRMTLANAQLLVDEIPHLASLGWHTATTRAT
jgi:hypothetical protein